LRRTALILSYLSHPAFAPVIALSIVLTSETYVSASLGPDLKRIALGLTFVNTFVLPLLFLSALKRIGIVSSLHLDKRKERIIPMAMGVFFYGFNFYLFYSTQYPRIIQQLALAMFLVALLSLLITFVTKLSIHAAGIASLFGGLLAFSKLFGLDLSFVLVFIAVLAGLVGTSRLLLDAHNASELSLGYVLGFAVSFSVVYFGWA